MFDFVVNVVTLALVGPVAANPLVPGFIRTAAEDVIEATLLSTGSSDYANEDVPVDDPAPQPETEVDTAIVTDDAVSEGHVSNTQAPTDNDEEDEADDRQTPASERRRILDELDYSRVKKPGGSIRKYAQWKVRGLPPPGSEVLSAYSEVRELLPEEDRDPSDTVDIEFDDTETPVIEPVAQTLKRKRDLAHLNLLDPEEAETVLKSDTSKIWTEFFVDLTGPGQVPFYLIDNVRYVPEKMYPWMLESIYEKSRAKGLCVYAAFGKSDDWKVFCRPVRIGDMDDVYLYKIETPTRDEVNDLIGFNGDIWLLIGGNDIFLEQPSVLGKYLDKALKKGVKCAKGHVPLGKLSDLIIKMIRKLQDIMKTYNTVTLRGWERTACLRRRFEIFEEKRSTLLINNEPPPPKQYRPRLRTSQNTILGAPSETLIGASQTKIRSEATLRVGPDGGLEPVSGSFSDPGLSWVLDQNNSNPVLTGAL